MKSLTNFINNDSYEYNLNETKNDLAYSLTFYENNKINKDNYGYGKTYYCDNLETLEDCYKWKCGTDFDNIKNDILKLTENKACTYIDNNKFVIITAIKK